MKKIIKFLILILITFLTASCGEEVASTACSQYPCKEWEFCNETDGVCLVKDGRCEDHSFNKNYNWAQCEYPYECNSAHKCEMLPDSFFCGKDGCKEWEQCIEVRAYGEKACLPKAGRCNVDSDCYWPGDICLEGNTCGKQDVCYEYACPSSSDCAIDGSGEPVCICDEGFHMEDNHCIENDPVNPCDGVTCSNKGTCKVDEQEAPYCDCSEGYEASGLECLWVDPCLMIDCMAWQVCDSQEAKCVLADGFCANVDETTECEGVEVCDVDHVCRDLCADKTCNPWETCEQATGICKDNPSMCESSENCTNTQDCNASHVCVEKCAAVTCDEWKSCEATTGNCLFKDNACDQQNQCSGVDICVEHYCTNLCENNSCSEWETCDQANGSCNLNEGRCTGVSDCTVVGEVCNISQHECITNPCSTWETYNQTSGNCDLNTGRCNTDNDCANELYCDSSNTCSDPCEGIFCGSDQYCEANNHIVECFCNDGLYMENNVCHAYASVQIIPKDDQTYDASLPSGNFMDGYYAGDQYPDWLDMSCTQAQISNGGTVIVLDGDSRTLEVLFMIGYGKFIPNMDSWLYVVTEIQYNAILNGEYDYTDTNSLPTSMRMDVGVEGLNIPRSLQDGSIRHYRLYGVIGPNTN